MKKLKNKNPSEVNLIRSKDIKLPPIKTNFQKPDSINNTLNSLSSNSQSKQINKQKSKKDITQLNNNQNNSKGKTLMKPKNLVTQKNLTKSSMRTRSENRLLRKTVKKSNNIFSEQIKELPKISQEKLAELKEKKNKRLKEQKIAEENDKKIYNQLMEEYKKIPEDKKQNNDLNKISLDNVPQIKMSEKKAKEILEEGGMLDAYNYLIIQLCKNGLPDGDVFGYASYIFKNYEKKWKEKKSKKLKEKIDKYYEDKKKEMSENSSNNMRINKSLENREEYIFIRDLDKSRSSRKIVLRRNVNLSPNIVFSTNSKNNEKVKPKIIDKEKINEKINNNNDMKMNVTTKDKKNEDKLFRKSKVGSLNKSDSLNKINSNSANINNNNANIKPVKNLKSSIKNNNAGNKNGKKNDKIIKKY